MYHFFLQIVFLCDRLPRFKEWLDSELDSPKSLRRCCRSAIRSHIRPENLKNVSELEIPRFLQDFLLCKDLTAEEVDSLIWHCDRQWLSFSLQEILLEMSEQAFWDASTSCLTWCCFATNGFPTAVLHLLCQRLCMSYILRHKLLVWTSLRILNRLKLGLLGKVSGIILGVFWPEVSLKQRQTSKMTFLVDIGQKKTQQNKDKVCANHVMGLMLLI